MASNRPALLLQFLVLLGALGAGLSSAVNGPAHAMGLGEDSPDTRIPEPSLSFAVVVRDRDLNSFEVVRASIDGHVYLSGKVGEAKVSIPFEKISRVDFEPTDGVTTTAVVTLKSGKQQSLEVRSAAVCYGEAEFGNMQIELRHLRDVAITGRASAP